ncbi:Gfo/Idh/MocA family protein [Parasegetibacter sp. NRK P23]|uniref:Gfo/Idh/MocA family protein n=1 Tax=Parasegetibacter sp. NRK P23 TaxID=2942999 RepID=UPI002043D9CD|nr:Gfo/Idh/MocA family oxidoreductase [Parasegetibacter sp. NRK P23]MCM5529170.1 Gfo/Idh/MocA family oxidoreductase [Parasegetibacter sp. NRK P23]
MKKTIGSSRRNFLYQSGLAGLGMTLFSPADLLPGSSSKPTTMPDKNGKLGIALVGLGNYATGQLAPALLQTEHCYLAGIVTGTPSKIPTWKEKYNIPDENIYNYDNYDRIKDNKNIDIIYVVLPNSMHAEYTIRGFGAGKHVICEKPMAITVEDCDKMLAAQQKAGKKFSIGYRLHFDPFNLEMARLGTQKVFGNLKKISGAFGFKAEAGQWRLSKQYAGGGPLMDLGIYVVQGMCYTSGMNPIAVTAVEGEKTDPVRFKEVEQSLSWEFEFQGGLKGEGSATYDALTNFLKAEAEQGSFELKPAYNYGRQRGYTPNGDMQLTPVNQQAKQMDAFALSIKNNQPSIVPGEMGRRDVKYLQAIYEAMRTGKKVKLS